MASKTHQKVGTSFFSSAARSSEWELIPLTNRRSQTTVTKHSTSYTNQKQVTMPHQKPKNSFPPGIFEKHWENVKEAQAEIAAAEIQPTEIDKENQQQSSLAAAVSTGKVRITEFFAKRTPLGRGGGMGLENKPMTGPGITAKSSTSIPIKAGISTVKQAKMPRNNAKGNHQTTTTMQKPTATTIPHIQGTAMTSPNITTATTNANQVHNFNSNNNVYTSPSLSNNPHGNGTAVSVNNGIFNSGLDNFRGNTKEDTRDTSMTGNDIGTTAGIGKNAGNVTANTAVPDQNSNSGFDKGIKVSDASAGLPVKGGSTDATGVNGDQGSRPTNGISADSTLAKGDVTTTGSDLSASTGTPGHTSNGAVVTPTSDVSSNSKTSESNNPGTTTGGPIPATAIGDSLSGDIDNGSGTKNVTVTKVFATTHTTVVDFYIRHKGKVTDFNLEEMFDGMVVAFTAVDQTIWFKSWNVKNENKIWSKATIPTEEDEMKEFVSDPHTAPIGPFGRFYGRMTIVSDIEFSSFRRDSTFSAFLRNTGLFIERGDLDCTRTRQIGFFNKKLPHDTRIPFFSSVLQQLITFRHPFQIISQPLYEGTFSVLKCFVYVMIADPRHEKELLEDLAVLRNTDLEFHPWSAFKDSKKRTTKVGIINDMNTFAIGHSSILIKGLQENCLMRMFSTKFEDDMDSPEEFVDACTMDDDLFTEYEVDLNYRLQQLSCIDFMYSHFVDSEGNPIYVQINGPSNGLIEVVFKNENWDHARRIEKQFQAIMIPFMTPASIKKSFTNGVSLAQRPPDSIHWQPPILTTKVNPANTMNEVSTPPLSKKLQHVNFSFTKNSTTSYKSAALAGIRKVDIPPATKLTTYDAQVGDVIPTLHHGNMVSTMSEEEILRRFQSYDDEILSLKQTFNDEITLLKTQVSEIALLKLHVAELQSLKTEVSQLSQQNTDTSIRLETYAHDFDSRCVATKKSITKLKRTTAAQIESSNAELRESIKRRSCKETRNTNKTQNMLRLLLDERKISYIEEDDDELDDSDDDEYMPELIEDPDDQYDSAEDSFFDDVDDDLADYDDTEPYISQHDNPIDESRKAASLSGLDKTNIIHQTSRTRSQSKSQSQGVAGSR